VHHVLHKISWKCRCSVCRDVNAWWVLSCALIYHLPLELLSLFLLCRCCTYDAIDTCLSICLFHLYVVFVMTEGPHLQAGNYQSYQKSFSKISEGSWGTKISKFASFDQSNWLLKIIRNKHRVQFQTNNRKSYVICQIVQFHQWFTTFLNHIPRQCTSYFLWCDAALLQTTNRKWYIFRVRQ